MKEIKLKNILLKKKLTWDWKIGSSEWACSPKTPQWISPPSE